MVEFDYTLPVNHFPKSPRIGFPEASRPPTPSRRSYTPPFPVSSLYVQRWRLHCDNNRKAQLHHMRCRNILDDERYRSEWRINYLSSTFCNHYDTYAIQFNFLLHIFKNSMFPTHRKSHLQQGILPLSSLTSRMKPVKGSRKMRTGQML